MIGIKLDDMYNLKDTEKKNKWVIEGERGPWCEASFFEYVKQENERIGVVEYID